jgi:hypothetical protein
MAVAIWLLVYLGIAFLIGRLYALFLGWGAVRVMFYPGILVAALGRQLACIVTGQKAKEIDTARKSGPVHAQAPPGGLGFRALFAFFPFALAVVTFLVVDTLLDHPIRFSARLPGIGIDEQTGRTLWDVGVDYVKSMGHALGSQEIGNWKAWLSLYTGFCLIVGSAPSSEDAKSVAVGLAGIALFLMALQAIQIDVSASRSSSVWIAFSTFFALALFVVVLSAVLFIPIKFLRDARKDEK